MVEYDVRFTIKDFSKQVDEHVTTVSYIHMPCGALHVPWNALPAVFLACYAIVRIEYANIRILRILRMVILAKIRFCTSLISTRKK